MRNCVDCDTTVVADVGDVENFHDARTKRGLKSEAWGVSA